MLIQIQWAIIETGGAAALSEELKTNTVMITFLLEGVLFLYHSSSMRTMEQLHFVQQIMTLEMKEQHF